VGAQGDWVRKFFACCGRRASVALVWWSLLRDLVEKSLRFRWEWCRAHPSRTGQAAERQRSKVRVFSCCAERSAASPARCALQVARVCARKVTHGFGFCVSPFVHCGCQPARRTLRARLGRIGPGRGEAKRDAAAPLNRKNTYLCPVRLGWAGRRHGSLRSRCADANKVGVGAGCSVVRLVGRSGTEAGPKARLAGC